MKHRRVSARRTHRVKIEKPVYTTDSLGDQVVSWGKHCIRWVSIKTGGGKEYFAAAQEQSIRSHSFRMSYDNLTKQITTAMRVVYLGRLLDIETAINIDGANREIELMCTERSAEVNYD